MDSSSPFGIKVCHLKRPDIRVQSTPVIARQSACKRRGVHIRMVSNLSGQRAEESQQDFLMEWGRVPETELMPRLVVGYAELGGGKVKRGKGFLKVNFEVLPKLGWPGVGYDGLIGGFQVVVGQAFIETPKFSTDRYSARSVVEWGSTPGSKTILIVSQCAKQIVY